MTKMEQDIFQCKNQPIYETGSIISTKNSSYTHL